MILTPIFCNLLRYRTPPNRYSEAIKKGVKLRCIARKSQAKASGDRNAPKRNDAITGVGKNFRIRSSGGGSNSKDQPQRQCVGLFVSRLAKSTKPRDVELHIDNEASMKVRCEVIPSKYSNPTVLSVFIRVSDREQKKLLDSKLWPSGALIRGYFE